MGAKSFMNSNQKASIDSLHSAGEVSSRKIFEIAMEYIHKSAESSCTEALTELGHINEMGGIRDPKTGKIQMLIKKKSISKAKELYLEAAEHGCELAQNYLGSLAFNHEKDFKKALMYFR